MEENRKKWLMIAVAAAVFLLLLLVGVTAVSWRMFSEKLAEAGVREPVQETEAGPQGVEGGEKKSHKAVRCMTQGLSFVAYEDWETVEEAEYAYVVWGKRGMYHIWLNGVSMLGSGTAQETYEEIALYYCEEEEYEFTDYDSEMTETVLEGGVSCLWGVIYGGDGQEIYDTMVVAVPQRNYLVTLGGYTEDGAEEEMLQILEELCASLRFEIGSRDEISGNTFVTESGGTLDLQPDGTFRFRESPEDEEEGGGYSGTYEVYYGQPAVDEAVASFGLPREIVEKMIAYNMAGYAPGGVFADNVPEGRMRYRICRDTFYVVTLHIERRIGEGGEEKDVEEEASYFGFYVPELRSTDFVDESTYGYAVWELVSGTEDILTKQR